MKRKLFNLLKNERTSLVLIFIGLSIIIFAIISFLWLSGSLTSNAPIDSEKFGQFGDFIGGIVGAIWALAGVLLFYVALNEQREDFKTNQKALELQIKALNQQVSEFKLQREELKSSRKIYEQQSKTLKLQQFESNFYSLLNIYSSIKDKLNNINERNDFFKFIYDEILIKYVVEVNIVEHNNEMISSYTKTFNKYRGHLSHYFKAFYRIIKIIDTSQVLEAHEKVMYSKILRSQLTDFEQLVLFYNSQSSYGLKARPLILKYNLLKHVPLFQKPEFEYYLDIQKDENILSFVDYLCQFMTKHINDSFDISFDGESIVEKDNVFNFLIGIHFADEIKVEVTCPKEDSADNFNLSDLEFSQLLYNIAFDKIIFSTYTTPSKIDIEKYITDKEQSRVIGVSINIDPDTALNLNFDKF